MAGEHSTRTYLDGAAVGAVRTRCATQVFPSFICSIKKKKKKKIRF